LNVTRPDPAARRGHAAAWLVPALLVAQATLVSESIPNAELVLFPNVGHSPHLEAPALFRPALLEFLQSEPFGGEVDLQ